MPRLCPGDGFYPGHISPGPEAIDADGDPDSKKEVSSRKQADALTSPTIASGFVATQSRAKITAENVSLEF